MWGSAEPPQLAPQPALSLPILIAEVEAEIGAFELSASASVAREHLLRAAHVWCRTGLLVQLDTIFSAARLATAAR